MSSIIFVFSLVKKIIPLFYKPLSFCPIHQRKNLSKIEYLMNTMNIFCCIFLACAYMTCHSLLITSASSDSITNSQALKDGETLVSTGAKFELGFFSPGSSKNRFLGIWYKNIPVITVVWVANRENPIQDFSGTLTINTSGSVVLSSRTNSMVWSADPIKTTQSPLLQILDSGNLILRDSKRDNYSDDYLWQSFDHPSDTLLPGMKLGWDLRTSLNRSLTSWKSPDDPSPGELASGVELDPYPQAVLYKGPRKYFRAGPWNGLRFSGSPQLKENPMYSFNFVSNEDEVYFIYHLKSESVITRFVVNQSTSTRNRWVWVEAQKAWNLFYSDPVDLCDTYGTCGANSLCKISDSPMCKCFEGFKPRLSQSWDAMDWSGGCVRDKDLNCMERHSFIKFSALKLPDTSRSWMNESMSLRECREVCLKNCSCTAYSNTDIRGRGSGCAFWFGDLLDIRELPEGGQDLYIRMSSSNQEKGPLVIITAAIIPIALFCGLLIIYYIYRRKMKLKGETDETRQDCSLSTDDFDLPIYELATITLATDHFSETNKLGEGGFGPVYKGFLNDGQIVAVKRLSKSSGQGLEEFKNEVKLIAKLQHRNLVKLIGCCIEGDEKILIYEYMPNGSLSSFLFDQRRSLELSWAKRFSIACGVARGLLYLHEDSRLRIIHRDLKASNVLLDDHLNPKISDFGMARIFGGDQIEESTSRIVGTYGYMAPEYALYGLFSVKSDVFSFGVLLLEIVSGKRNRGTSQNLTEYAWKLWTEGKAVDMIEPKLNGITPEINSEISRCIHVGLLCVQENPEDRPNMSTVVIMLNGESALPHPKPPGFLINFVSCRDVRSSSSHKDMSLSINDYSMTTLDGR